MYCGSATHFLCVIDSEFLAKESNEHFWSFVEAVTQFALDSPECEYGNYWMIIRLSVMMWCCRLNSRNNIWHVKVLLQFTKMYVRGLTYQLT